VENCKCPFNSLQTHRDAIREIALSTESKCTVFGRTHGDDTKTAIWICWSIHAGNHADDIAKIQVEVARLLNITVDVLTPALPDKFRDK